MHLNANLKPKITSKDGIQNNAARGTAATGAGSGAGSPRKEEREENTFTHNHCGGHCPHECMMYDWRLQILSGTIYK